MIIREAEGKDLDGIWPIFHEVVSAGETYAYPRDTTKNKALNIWVNAPRKTFVAEENGNILGTYYIKTNQAGPGSHVCNCGYMVSSKARGKGLATAMCEHGTSNVTVVMLICAVWLPPYLCTLRRDLFLGAYIVVVYSIQQGT